MTEAHEKLFETLEPPPGGAARLRSRLAADREPRARPWRGQLAAAVMLCAAIAAALWTGLKRPALTAAATPELDLVRMYVGLLPPPSEPVTIPPDLRDTVAIARVPLATDRVVFYRIGSVRSAEADGQDAGAEADRPASR